MKQKYFDYQSALSLKTGKHFVIPGSFDFEEAVLACEQAGGSIANVNSCSDDSEIRKLMMQGPSPMKNAWIGLRRASHRSDTWRWVPNGETLKKGDFTGWWPGYPDDKDDSDDCVIYQTWEVSPICKHTLFFGTL